MSRARHKHQRVSLTRRRSRVIDAVTVSSLLLFVVLGGVAFRHRLHRDELSPSRIAKAEPSSDRDDSEPVPAATAPMIATTTTKRDTPPRRDQAATTRVTGDPSRAQRDEAAREERLLMAKTWKLTPEQYEKFEAAATSPHSERGALFASMAAGAITRDELEQELAKVEARDAEQLREAIGPHYQEYTLMRGHFAEAELDQKPFQPPVYETPSPDPR